VRALVELVVRDFDRLVRLGWTNSGSNEWCLRVLPTEPGLPGVLTIQPAVTVA